MMLGGRPRPAAPRERRRLRGRLVPPLLLLRRAWADGPGAATGPGHGTGTLPPLCAGCLREPVEADYFGGALGGEPPRTRWSALPDKGLSAFAEAAAWGKVLLIEDASRGTALSGWTCRRLSEEFPAGRMRREYDWQRNPDDLNTQPVGGASWLDAAIPGEEASDRLERDPSAPPFAPFYWGVREHQGGEVGDAAVVAKLRGLIAASVPAFMDASNARSMFDNAEFWMGARGTGARAHMDSHCLSTLSVVLSGERRWRIGPPPRMPKGAGRSEEGDVVFDDGVAYDLGWRPMFEFTARAGEAVLFPPGWIHETLNSDDNCTLALTTQFELPKPTHYWRNFYGRLRRIGDLGPCWGEMRQLATGAPDSRKGSRPPRDDEAAKEEAETRMRAEGPSGAWSSAQFFDLDGDGATSAEEFVGGFVAWAATERAVRRERARRPPEPDMGLGVPGVEEASPTGAPAAPEPDGGARGAEL